MKLPILKMGTTFLLPVLLRAGTTRLNADIVMDPGTVLEDRIGYVIDGGKAQIVYNQFNINSHITDADVDHAGASSFLSQDVVATNSNTLSISGTTFDLESRATAGILMPAASLVFAHAYADYIAYFHVTSTQAFDPLVSVSADVAMNGQGQSFQFIAWCISLRHLVDPGAL